MFSSDTLLWPNKEDAKITLVKSISLIVQIKNLSMYLIKDTLAGFVGSFLISALLVVIAFSISYYGDLRGKKRATSLKSVLKLNIAR